MLENTEGAKPGSSRETGNIGYTRHVSCVSYVASSLDFPFLLPLRYSLTFICPLSDETYVASFSGLSFFIAPYRRGNKKGQSRETGNIG
jgi:hypothetical protein